MAKTLGEVDHDEYEEINNQSPHTIRIKDKFKPKVVLSGYFAVGSFVSNEESANSEISNEYYFRLEFVFYSHSMRLQVINFLGLQNMSHFMPTAI